MLSTNIPADMQDFIDKTIGHQDYAPYVLDGQSAERDGSADDYHDAVAVVEDWRGFHVLKFTMHPDQSITHYTIKD